MKNVADDCSANQLRIKRAGKMMPERMGAASAILILLATSVLLVGVLFYVALRLRPEATRESSLGNRINIYCAAGIAKPVQKVLDRYNAEFQTNLVIQRTGGSGELAGQIKTEFETGVEDGADLYITADQMLLEKAHAQGIVSERFDLAIQRPVVAIRAGFSLEHLDFKTIVESNSVKIGISSTRAAVGKLVRKIAKRDGFLELLEKNKVTDFENVMTLAQALVAGSIDVALVWDTTVAQINQNSKSKDALTVHCRADPEDNHQSNIAIGVLSTTDKPTQCLKLARYLTASEKAESDFTSYGFSFLAGDPWDEVPEIHLFCGSMFTPVIENAVRDFANREGINLYPKWEGCGKLVTRMKLGNDGIRFPDAYFACDQMFLEEVREHFRPPLVVSKNEMVICVRKNLKIRCNQVDDLMRMQIRVGLCDPDQSALGKLTKKMLETHPESDFYQRLSAKASVIVDVGPTLVSQLLAGGLDAAIVYRSNIMADPKALEELSVVELKDSNPFSVATQPWAVSKTTKFPKLLDRLFEWLQREPILQKFEEMGFNLVQPPTH